VSAAGRPVVHLDSDGFHQSRDIRYRQGRESAHGYYEDAYDFSSLVRLTLEPLGPGGRLVYATCDLYVAEQDPRGRADVVVDNTDPERPSIVRGVDP
jgi:uridine kinase